MITVCGHEGLRGQRSRRARAAMNSDLCLARSCPVEGRSWSTLWNNVSSTWILPLDERSHGTLCRPADEWAAQKAAGKAPENERNLFHSRPVVSPAPHKQAHEAPRQATPSVPRTISQSDEIKFIHALSLATPFQTSPRCFATRNEPRGNWDPNPTAD